MRTIISWIICVALVVFLGCGIVSAGLLNEANTVKEFINNLEGKAGYIWLAEVKEGKSSYVPQLSGSLYTFNSPESTFRIGSIDLAYVGGSKKFLLETLFDSNILKTFQVPMLGELGLEVGLGLGIDFDKVDNWHIGKDDFIWGVPTVGFKLQF